MDRWGIDLDVSDLFRRVRMIEDPVERIAAFDVVRETASRALATGYGEAMNQAQRQGRSSQVYAGCALTPRHMRRLAQGWRAARGLPGPGPDLSDARVLSASGDLLR
jgi:hypothetical protein